MSDHGARVAASRFGITVKEYREHEARDEHWCRLCHLWLPRATFYVDRSKPRGADGLCKVHRTLDTHRQRQRRRSRRHGISYAGPAFARRVALTARGAAAATIVSDTAWSGRCAQNAATVPSGHSACPPSIRHICEGNLPAGWVREGTR